MPGRARRAANTTCPGEIVISTPTHQASQFSELLEQELHTSIMELEGDAPLMARMARFHLGWIETNGEPTTEEVRLAVQGKRIRPQLAFLATTSVGGDAKVAAPLAAAVELLHNFTLIHDDIQDRSPNRRHRATVWRIWGDAQAINAGDALFATAQRALLRTNTDQVPAKTLLNLLDEFNRVTIEIVRGQVMDLEFEREASVAPDDYLRMIGGKTAAIVRFAAWSGAIIGGASAETAQRLGEFGEALGIGFQIRDDVLGIWGAEAETGKDQGDDIRRRKKSLPILMLFDRARAEASARLAELYDREEIDDEGVAEVLRMLEVHGVEASATEQVAHYHRVAADSLQHAIGQSSSNGLGQLIDRLDTRSS